ncbi:uncharacterized protein [Aristolochia californica]|uniref:uncharacterized protein n=1 Tax=Aristolochia californica TaxID=171875 RepID=UPI0035DAB377
MERLRGYWRRKSYVRLDGLPGRRRKSRVEISTVDASRRRRFWRIRIAPRLKLFRIASPKRFFLRLRDAYVRMMLSFANSSVFSGGYGYGNDVPGRVGFGKGPLKEYDEKVIVEIYKTLVAQGQLMARQGGGKLPEIPARPA